MTMINVGLVGFGLSGRYLQAPFFVSNPSFNLKAIITSQDIPKVLFPNAVAAKNFEFLLNDLEIDLVSIASPNSTHYELAKKALLAGKHVLVEKPMTASVAEAQELIEIAKKKNRVLSVFQNRRFDSDFLTVRRVVESNLLGDLLSFEASYDRYKPELNSKQWKEQASPASGILYDLGSHLIDQAICLFGAPDRVEGETFTQRSNSQIDDTFNLRLDYGKLKVSLKSSLMVKEKGPRYILHGTKGSFLKFGLDVQEDQLKSGQWPHNSGFGKESEIFNGTLRTELNGLEVYGKIETLCGNWMKLFENLASVINGHEELVVKPEEVLLQLKVIEQIKAL